MRLYLDTSALVKLYANEEGSADVRDAVSRARVVATSAIAYVEAQAAFARRHREGRLSLVGFRRWVRRFEADWPRYLRLEVTYSLIRRAARIADKYRLRAYDAVHLESALTLRERLAAPVVFGCWDAGLVAAAHKAGLDTIPGLEG